MNGPAQGLSSKMYRCRKTFVRKENPNEFMSRHKHTVCMTCLNIKTFNVMIHKEMHRQYADSDNARGISVGQYLTQRFTIT